MRADIHDGPEHMLQSEAGYIDATPLTPARQNLLQRTAGPYIWVNAQSRCAPARCAGARAERLVADGEDGDSGVASINSRIVGVQRMIKNSRIIWGQPPFTT